MAQLISSEFSAPLDPKVCTDEEPFGPILVPEPMAESPPPVWGDISTTPSGPNISVTDAGSSSGAGGNHVKPPVPVAICGMAMRLPGGISSAEAFWDFLVNKGDACARIPAERYATHGPQGNSAPSPGTWFDGGGGSDATTEKEADKPHWRTHGYMLNQVDLAAFDASLFSMTRAELEIVDPQQRLLLELTRCLIP